MNQQKEIRDIHRQSLSIRLGATVFQSFQLQEPGKGNWLCDMELQLEVLWCASLEELVNAESGKSIFSSYYRDCRGMAGRRVSADEVDSWRKIPQGMICGLIHALQSRPRLTKDDPAYASLCTSLRRFLFLLAEPRRAISQPPQACSVSREHWRIPDVDTEGLSREEQCKFNNEVDKLCKEMGIRDYAADFLRGSLWIILSLAVPLSAEQKQLFGQGIWSLSQKLQEPDRA